MYYSDCIISICNKTNTNLLHTNWLHSMLHKIGQAKQIVINQFVRKTTAKKILESEKKWPSLIPRYVGIRRISTKEKKIDPL